MKFSGAFRAVLAVALTALVGGCNHDYAPVGTSTGAATSVAGGNSSVGGTSTRGTSGAAGNTAAGGSLVVASSVGGTTAGGAITGGDTSTGGTVVATGSDTSTGGTVVATGGDTSTVATGGNSATGGTTSASNVVYFVKQANGTVTASMENGTITVVATHPLGNAFKYVAPNYYGTNSNGFIALPTPLTGDFAATAIVNVSAQNNSSSLCGIGLGITTGFQPTDEYAYILMRNSSSVINAMYVSAAGVVGAGSPSVSFTVGTPMQLTFSRSDAYVTYGAGPVGGTIASNTANVSYFTDGTSVYGGAAVYPVISFNNVNATITKMVITDASGATVFDSDTGTLVANIPAALAVSPTSVAVNKGASFSVTATANAIGGAIAAVTATAADPSIVDVSVTNGSTQSTVNLTGLKGGVTKVTVTNTGDSNTAANTKTIAVTVIEYPSNDAYGSLAGVTYPAAGSTGAYTDGELSLTFDAPPTLATGESIHIYRLSDGVEADSIGFDDEMQRFGTTSLNVGNQLVRINGNTVSFVPHLGKLAYGTGYYVAIPTASILGKLATQNFTGLSNLSNVASWSFTTRPAPILDAANITVDGAPNSTANFRTIQGALSAISNSLPTSTSVHINVAPGTYADLLRYTGTGIGAGQTVTISGPAGNNKGDNCIVQWANGNSMNASTQTRALFYFTGANLVLENLTLKNTGARSAVAQAEALYFGGGAGMTMAAYNSSFYSNQDTIQTSGRNWFYECYIEGNVDFIWGTADAALFESCDLRFVNDLGGAAASYSLAVARTGTTIASGASGTVGKGYVVLNSTVSVDSAVTAYFGRNAGAGSYYDQVALVNVVFTGGGTIGAGIWNVTTSPTILGDARYVGWKSADCSGLNLASLTTAGNTAAAIASQSSEYDTRDHILNRVVTVTSGVPNGFQSAAVTWDVSGLETAWNVN